MTDHFNYSNEVEIQAGNLPDHYMLSQNYPNPFNPTTQINYSIPKDGFVSLRVYNALGQMVADLVNREVKAGTYKVDFDAAKLSSGVYIYQLKAVPGGRQAGSYIDTKKMILLK